MTSAVFPGRFKSLAAISAFVRQAARAAGLNDDDIYAVELAVDEACSNIIDHAYGGEGKGKITCTCEVVESGLVVTLHDQGQAFDPGQVNNQELGVPIEDLKPRGAGLYLMRKLMDEVRFDFDEHDGNVLTLVKRKSS